jgi:hypothetical protein
VAESIKTVSAKQIGQASTTSAYGQAAGCRNTSAAAVKGRRLTVNLIDENGKRRRIIIPDGQKFKLDNISVNDPKKGPLQAPSMEYFQNQFKLLGSLILSTIDLRLQRCGDLYAVHADSTGLSLLRIPVTALAVFIPYSGYVDHLPLFHVQVRLSTHYVGRMYND